MSGERKPHEIIAELRARNEALAARVGNLRRALKQLQRAHQAQSCRGVREAVRAELAAARPDMVLVARAADALEDALGYAGASGVALDHAERVLTDLRGLLGKESRKDPGLLADALVAGVAGVVAELPRLGSLEEHPIVEQPLADDDIPF